MYGNYECFVMQMFVNAGRGGKRRHMEEAYSRAALMTPL